MTATCYFNENCSNKLYAEGGENEENGLKLSKDQYLEEGIQLGQTLDRYQICSVLGEGTFGQVVKAYDIQEQIFVAIKIIKEYNYNKTEPLNELEILELINHTSGSAVSNNNYIVQLKRHFMWLSRLCLVFELLSCSLEDFLKTTNELSLPVVRMFGEQLCKALNFLRLPKLNIVHCDLKPSNILVADARATIIKLADFGCACQEGNIKYSYIQSRYYRAPEVLLGLPYNSAIDMWSLGCILAELHTGKPLFVGCDEICQMHKIIEVMGMPPKQMLDEGSNTHKWFDKNVTDDSYVLKCNHACKQPALSNIYKILGVTNGGPKRRYQCDADHSIWDYFKFAALLLLMLDYNPKTRITPDKALQHSFFK